MGLLSALNKEPHPPEALQTPRDYAAALQRAMLQPVDGVGSMQGDYVSVLAVVVAFEKPVKSKGSDYVMRLRIMDPTVPAGGQPLALTVFRARTEDMPDVRAAGDIIYFDTAKVTVFGSRAQLISNNRSQWDIVHTAEHPRDEHPLVVYLRKWWMDGGGGGWTMGTGEVESPGAKLASGRSNKYLRTMSEVQGQPFADMYLEVVQVADSSTNIGIDDVFPGQPQMTDRIQCLVTDYTTNPLINTSDPSNTNGHCAWLTVFEPRSINRMPRIEVGGVYWMRSVRAEYSDIHGLTLRLSSSTMYPNTILVVRVPPDDEHARALLARKAEYVASAALKDHSADDQAALAHPEENGKNGEHEDDAHSDSHSSHGGWRLRIGGEPVKAHIDYCVYRVKALVVGVYPPTPERTLVFVCDVCGQTQEHMPVVPAMRCARCNEPGALEFRLLLRLRDSSSECVAVCQGIGDGQWAQESSWLMSDDAARSRFIDGIALLWRAVHPAYGGTPGAMLAEALVTSVVGPAPAGSLGRTLLVTGGMHSIFLSHVVVGDGEQLQSTNK
ncbi:hypothetical protein EV175_003330 [Coemansia sp. RSA 1933]|nr:hypothetical protein EV175_003330 [Coemansia sp. RSA 1933]